VGNRDLSPPLVIAFPSLSRGSLLATSSPSSTAIPTIAPPALGGLDPTLPIALVTVLVIGGLLTPEILRIVRRRKP
jgi:hypothetical protein